MFQVYQKLRSRVVNTLSTWRGSGNVWSGTGETLSSPLSSWRIVFFPTQVKGEGKEEDGFFVRWWWSCLSRFGAAARKRGRTRSRRNQTQPRKTPLLEGKQTLQYRTIYQRSCNVWYNFIALNIILIKYAVGLTYLANILQNVFLKLSKGSCIVELLFQRCSVPWPIVILPSSCGFSSSFH